MTDVLLAALALGTVLGVVGGLFWSRQRTLTRRVASFGCLLRDAPAGPWRPGIAQYGVGRLMWWTGLSLSPRPARTWGRAHLELLGRTPLGQIDDRGRPLVQLRCQHRDAQFDVIISAPACAGLVSWLESAPRQVRRVH